MKKKTLFQILALTFVSVTVMFIFGIVAVDINAKSMLRERLAEETELACALVQTEEDFANFAQYSDDVAFRVTIIDLSGEVLYESSTKAPLENHIDREEVKYALAGNSQVVERYSQTFECDMTYYALWVVLPILIVVLIGCFIFSVVISNLLSAKMSGKITEVGDSLRSLNDGNYVPIKTNSGEPELYSVLNQINELNASAHAHIKSMKETSDKLNTVLANVSQGIVAIDENKRIIFANKSIVDIFGASENLDGKDFIYLIDDLALCEKISRHLGENYTSEYGYKGKDLSVVIRKAENNSDDVYSIVIITDVTDEKAVQRQKSDFFANASHELKTPVAVMQGLSELLLSKDILDEGSKKQVARIHSESVRLASLITDMLELSKLENGDSVDAVYSPVDIKAIAEEVASGLSPELKKKNITLEIFGNGTVTADGKMIFEIVENLCSNAAHYNVENGKITVTISENDNETKLTVADTGIGIEKEYIPRLCERFYRVDKSRSKKTGGTGLGLAIVKHICALYNAELSIESEVGVGTTVSVKFAK